MANIAATHLAREEVGEVSLLELGVNCHTLVGEHCLQLGHLELLHVLIRFELGADVGAELIGRGLLLLARLHARHLALGSLGLLGPPGQSLLLHYLEAFLTCCAARQMPQIR